jgi:hypothetical protein
MRQICVEKSNSSNKQKNPERVSLFRLLRFKIRRQLLVLTDVINIILYDYV